MKRAAIVLCLGALIGCAQHLQAAAETHSFTNLNRAVPDGNASGLAEFRNLNSAIHSISQVRVKLQVIGEYNGDLYAYLRHNNGLSVLLNRVGRTAADSAGYDDAGFTVTFEHDAANGDIHLYRNTTTPSAGSPLTGTWQPDGRKVDPGVVLDSSARTASLDVFNGAAASGEWTLFIADLESGGTNLLQGWELEITGAVRPALVWTNPADIVYGAALGGTQLNATSDVPGTFSYNPPAGTVLHAGTGQVLNVTFTPSDSANYLVASTNVVINVLQKPLTITAENKAKVYGAPAPLLTATYSGFVNGDEAADLDISPSLSTLATAASPVGTYAITVNGAADPDYAITFVNGALTVTPAPLIVTADDKSKIYGASLPILTASFNGFVNGDSEASLDTPVTFSTSASASSPVGSYAINPGGATDANYDISFVAGTLAITPAALTITAEDKTKIYGAPLPTFTAAYTGFVNGDTPAHLDTAPSFATAATSASNVGTYDIVPEGAADGNYNIGYVNGTLTITPAATTGIVSSSANPATPGQAVTFTFALDPVPPGTGTPTGTVRFVIDGALAGTASLSSSVANYTTSTLSLGAHTVTAEYAGDGNFTGATNSLSPDQVINTPPVAGSDLIERFGTNRVKVSFASLLSNDSDADGDALTISSVNLTSTNGGTITIKGTWITYAPPSGNTNDDAFTYTIADGRGAQVVGTVLVQVRADTVPSPNLVIDALGDGSYRLHFAGIPDRAYRIQYTDDLENPEWETLTTLSADNETGAYEYIDTPPAGSATRFYRSVYP